MSQLTADVVVVANLMLLSLFNLRFLEEFETGWSFLLREYGSFKICFPVLSHIGVVSVMTTVKFRL